MTIAFYLSPDRTPLDPLTSGAAIRQLLKSGGAAILRNQPMVLISKSEIQDDSAQGYRLKISPGSKTTGFAIVRDDGRVVWGAELTHRGSAIASALESRRSLRRGRRGRKTRYRAPRFLNRTRPEGWLAPSLESRVQNILTWVNRIIRFCPITAISMELLKFDTQEMQNPGIEGVEYQQGTLAGYSIREYLYQKWKRTCAYCGFAEFKGDKRQAIPGGKWTVDHIRPRSPRDKSGPGSDRISNLALCCYRCNQKKNNRSLEEFVKDPDKRRRILAQTRAPLKDAAIINSTRWALYGRLKEMGLPLECGSGGRTAFNRYSQGLPKSRWVDAACVGASTPILDITGIEPLQIKATGHGSRKMQGNDAYGFPKGTPRLRLKRRHGFQTGDIAIATIPKGKYAGRVVGRVGAVRATKSIVIRGVSVHPRHCRLIQKADGYDYQMAVATK